MRAAWLTTVAMMLMSLVTAAQGQAVASPPLASHELSSPSGGWKQGGLTDQSEKAAVAYPYSPIDRGAQINRTMIRGRVAAAAKGRGEHKLVVNGNPTPLYTDEQGNFCARLYVWIGLEQPGDP